MDNTIFGGEGMKLLRVVGHPDGEKRTFVPNMEGPDGQCVREREDAHHGGLDDQSDHLELDQYIEELNISILGGG